MALDSTAQTLILVQILVEILIVVEVAEHEGGLGGDHAGLLLDLVHVLCNTPPAPSMDTSSHY